MPNLVNTTIVSEYEELFGNGLDALFVQPLGMEVEEVNEFRARLGESQLRMQLVKNSLARRVLADKGLTELASIFEGPAAVILPEADAEVDAVAITAAKVVAKWRKDSGVELPALKGGVMEGEVLDADRAKALEKMPGRAELQSMIAGQILAPGRNLAAQLIGPGGRIAGAVKSQIENLEKAG